MTDKQQHIDSVLQKLNTGADELDALLFLQGKGLNEAACKEIMEEAIAQKQKERMPHLAKKNKGLFALWILLTAIVLFIDFFVLPDASLLDYKFILCLLGTLALALCCYFSILYYKTWTPPFLEKHVDVRISMQGFPLILIPGLIVYFLMSWRFSSAADQSLSRDMVKTKGTIVSGTSIGGRRGDLISEVTVRFKTKEGKTIFATEDVSSYDFKNFYTDQEIEMVYSKSNPTNIDLLTPGSDVKELTKSEERDILPNDLIALMNVAPENVGTYLDKISFGWEMDATDSSWINRRKDIAIKVSSDRVLFTTSQNTGMIFPKRLKELGFKASGSNSTQPYSLKPQLFEKDGYLVSIEFQNMENTIICMISVLKK